MQILINTGKDLRPEFWGWSSYTQQACLSGFSLLSFFFFLVGRQVFNYTLIMIYCVFTEEQKLKTAINSYPPGTSAAS